MLNNLCGFIIPIKWVCCIYYVFFKWSTDIQEGNSTTRNRSYLLTFYFNCCVWHIQKITFIMMELDYYKILKRSFLSLEDKKEIIIIQIVIIIKYLLWRVLGKFKRHQRVVVFLRRYAYGNSCPHSQMCISWNAWQASKND